MLMCGLLVLCIAFALISEMTQNECKRRLSKVAYLGLHVAHLMISESMRRQIN